MNGPEGFYFDEAAAARVERFFPACLRHVKGRWAGRPFELLPWQREIVRELFGWRRELDGARRYRTAYIEVPRKNGKTSFGAGLAVYLLVADGELGAEVYSAAADRDQAAICFEIAKGMLTSGPLERHVSPFRRSIAYHRTASLYRPLSSDVPTKHGLNPSGIVFDELHAQKSRDLWDTLETGKGARLQPLTVAITTAGTDPASLCGEIAGYADQVARGVVDDPSFYSFVRRADPEAPWRDPATWELANPSYGATVFPEFFEAEARRAAASPAYENTFRRLYLNQWLRQETRWLNLDAWDACAGEVGAADLPAALEGRVAYGGLDLSSNADLTAWVLVFPPLEPDGPFEVVPRFFIPEERVADRVRRDRVPYEAWVREGWIETTPGNVVDWRTIRDRIETDSGTYRIAEVAFDRWGAVHVSSELQEAGLVMVQFGQGYASMSPPTKDLERLILEQRVQHGGHPVLRWNVDNVAVEQDPAGNLKPSKRRSTEKIDGVVALIMGLDRATRGGANPDPASVYDERGIRTL